MSVLEQILSGVVLLFVGGLVTRLFFPGVSTKMCKLNHANLEKYLQACLEPIHQRLERIEKKLDTRNGTRSADK